MLLKIISARFTLNSTFEDNTNRAMLQKTIQNAKHCWHNKYSSHCRNIVGEPSHKNLSCEQ